MANIEMGGTPNITEAERSLFVTALGLDMEIKTGNFVAKVGGGYLCAGVAVVVTLPTARPNGSPLQIGDSFLMLVASGTAIVFNPSMVSLAVSSIPHQFFYNGSAWVTLLPVFQDAITFTNGSAPGTVTSLCTVADSALTTITLTDYESGKIIRCTAPTAVSVVIPNTLSAGFNCTIIQFGAGIITFSQSGGATINSYGAAFKTAGQHASASIVRIAAATFNIAGNLTP